MNFFEGLMSNQIFVCGFVSWFIAQAIKVLLTILKEKRFAVDRMMGSGGMPSSHSSSVMGVSTAVGLIHGWETSLYAVALMFALIVMYDASNVRRNVGKQAILLNNIIEDLYKHHHVEQERLIELVGHTPVEVFAGALLGIVVANVMCG
jgi:acid phosphatase family membrane protein YuiD